MERFTKDFYHCYLNDLLKGFEVEDKRGANHCVGKQALLRITEKSGGSQRF